MGFEVPGTDGDAVFVVAVTQGVVVVFVVHGVVAAAVVTHTEVTGGAEAGVTEAQDHFLQVTVFTIIGVLTGVRVVVVHVGDVVAEVAQGARVTGVQVVLGAAQFGAAP